MDWLDGYWINDAIATSSFPLEYPIPTEGPSSKFSQYSELHWIGFSYRYIIGRILNKHFILNVISTHKKKGHSLPIAKTFESLLSRGFQNEAVNER